MSWSSRNLGAGGASGGVCPVRLGGCVGGLVVLLVRILLCAVSRPTVGTHDGWFGVGGEYRLEICQLILLYYLKSAIIFFTCTSWRGFLALSRPKGVIRCLPTLYPPADRSNR